MNELKPTETFFDQHGEIVCVTRVERDSRGTMYYGAYCTGDKKDERNQDGTDREFGFRANHMHASYPRKSGSINTNVQAAFADAGQNETC